jgi:hypothetical protein
METFFGNILALIIVVAAFIGIALFLQLLSKISGKNIKQKYGSSTVRPDDFDNSIKSIKKTTDDLTFLIKKLNLNNSEQIIYKFDKILVKLPGLKFSNYLKSKNNFEHIIAKIVSGGKISEKELLERMNLSGIVYDGIIDNKTYNLLTNYRISYGISLNTFDQQDLKTIQSFIEPMLENDQNKLIEFLDSLGCENFKDFATVIERLEMMYLNNKITLNEINNIKIYILRRKRIIESLI